MSTHKEDLFDALADMIADRVAARFQRPVTIYSTSARGPWIAGKTRAWMLRNVKTMPGAIRVGRDWTISHDDVEKWSRLKDVAEHKAPVSNVEELAKKYLRDDGSRFTKKSA